MRQRTSAIVVIAVCFFANTVLGQTEKHVELDRSSQALQSAYGNGKLKEAKKIAQATLALMDEIYGAESKESLQPMLILANIIASQNDYKDAKATYLRAFSLARKHYGDSSGEMEQVRANHSYYMNSLELIRWYSTDEGYAKQFTEFWGFEYGKAKKVARPQWPAEMDDRYRSARHRVLVKVSIDEFGKVTKADGMIGDPGLFAYAVPAALKSEFEPTLKNGKATAVTNFILFTLSVR